MPDIRPLIAIALTALLPSCVNSVQDEFSEHDVDAVVNPTAEVFEHAAVRHGARGVRRHCCPFERKQHRRVCGVRARRRRFGGLQHADVSSSSCVTSK